MNTFELKRAKIDVLVECLTPEEMLASTEKRSQAALHSWLLGRLAAKITLADLLQVKPQNVNIYAGPDGKPLYTAPGVAKVIDFSISHTKGLAAAVASPGGRAGLDVESLSRTISAKVTRLAFTPQELALVAEADKHKVFPGLLAVWCAKEAAGKSWGRPLLNHLSQVKATWTDWSKGLVMVEGFGQKAEVRLEARHGYLMALVGPF